MLASTVTLGGRAAIGPRPTELPADRSRFDPPATDRTRARSPAAPLSGRLEGGAGFFVQQLLAAAPAHLGEAPAIHPVLAAYQAHLARRISYSGPVTPIDLRV